MARVVHITRRERFSAAHKLFIEDWSAEKNLETFGNCANPNWHGHNYELFVTVKSEVDELTGFVMDLKILSAIVNEKVIAHLDHKNVNLDTPFMQGKITTTENICMAIWDEIASDINAKGATLTKIKLQETENNFVEYYGE